MKKMEPCLLCLWSFILGFTNEMTNKILHFNISKIFINDFVCKVKLKFLFCTKIFRNPPNTTNIFLMATIDKRVNSKKEHSIDDFVGKKILIINILRSEQCQGKMEEFSQSLKYTDGNILLVYPCVMNIINNVREKGNSSHRH